MTWKTCGMSAPALHTRRWLVQSSAALLQCVADVMAPPRCAVCGTFIEHHGRLCAVCSSRCVWLGSEVCERCGCVWPSVTQPAHLCGACIMHPPRFDRARSLGIYAGALREAVCALKFSGRTMVARPLGRWLAQSGAAVLGPRRYDCIVPVPLHVTRLRQRGFNQAVLLARQVSQAWGIGLDRLALRRVHATQPQARLAARLRTGNVRGAFAASRSRVAGQRILVIDDVYTSGATADACAAALKRAGATAVDVLTVARAVREIHGGDVRPGDAAHCC